MVCHDKAETEKPRQSKFWDSTLLQGRRALKGSVKVMFAPSGWYNIEEQVKKQWHTGKNKEI